MNTKAVLEGPKSSLDTIKWLLVVIFVAIAAGGNYLYADQPVLYRVLAIVFVLILAIATGLQTEKGRNFAVLIKEARVEIRKVIWPTKQETIQTTGVVGLVIAVTVLFLFLIDMAIGFSMSLIL